jgi:U3 small nucleolar RNA-associated protein 25
MPLLPPHLSLPSCLFNRRFQLRGAQHVIFYSLPEYAHFFPEIVNGLGDSGDGSLGSDISCLVLFTQYEKMALERMVGAKRCAHILSSAKTTFMFC